MPRSKITYSDDLKAMFETYQVEHGYKSLSETIVKLARIGLEAETGDTPPEAHQERGGWRGNDKSLENLLYYVDRLTDYGRNDPKE